MARKRSHQTRLILQTFLDAPGDEAYGLAVVHASGVGPGSAYAILRRLEDDGILAGRWEQVDATDAGRPPRRYYRLTAPGRKIALQETAVERDALRILVPGWMTR
jgi:PadR family transcriptional regulator, regulatory protein PadR